MLGRHKGSTSSQKKTKNPQTNPPSAVNYQVIRRSRQSNHIMGMVTAFLSPPECFWFSPAGFQIPKHCNILALPNYYRSLLAGDWGKLMEKLPDVKSTRASLRCCLLSVPRPSADHFHLCRCDQRVWLKTFYPAKFHASNTSNRKVWS